MLRKEAPTAARRWPLPAWAVSPTAQLLLPPRALTFAGDAAAVRPRGGQATTATPRLDVMWAPRVAAAAAASPPQFVFCCELWAARAWRRVYAGPEPCCDLRAAAEVEAPQGGAFLFVRVGRLVSATCLVRARVAFILAFLLLSLRFLSLLSTLCIRFCLARN
jgi:hypothetical protein